MDNETKQKLQNAKIIVNGLEFKQFIYSLNQLLFEVPLEFENGILSATCTDSANVALIQRKIKYIGDIPFWKCLVNITNINDFITATYSEDMSDFDLIQIRFEFKETDLYMCLGNGFGEVKFPTMNFTDKDCKVPYLKNKAKFKINRLEFNKYIITSNCFADSVTFEIKDNYFCISTRGDISCYNKDNIVKCTATNFKSKYSIEYIKKALFYTNDIIINFDKDSPLEIEDTDGNLFILAPRIEND